MKHIGVIAIQALGLAAFCIFGSVIAGVAAVFLAAPGIVGLALQRAWGRPWAVAFSWFALCVSFALAAPDKDSLSPNGLGGLLHREPTTFELAAFMALCMAPWLLCIHWLRRTPSIAEA